MDRRGLAGYDSAKYLRRLRRCECNLTDETLSYPFSINRRHADERNRHNYTVHSNPNNARRKDGITNGLPAAQAHPSDFSLGCYMPNFTKEN